MIAVALKKVICTNNELLDTNFKCCFTVIRLKYIVSYALVRMETLPASLVEAIVKN